MQMTWQYGSDKNVILGMRENYQTIITHTLVRGEQRCRYVILPSRKCS